MRQAAEPRLTRRGEPAWQFCAGQPRGERRFSHRDDVEVQRTVREASTPARWVRRSSAERWTAHRRTQADKATASERPSGARRAHHALVCLHAMVLLKREGD